MTHDRNETYLLVGTPSVLGSYTQNHASVELLGMWVVSAVAAFGVFRFTVHPRAIRSKRRWCWKASRFTSLARKMAKASSGVTAWSRWRKLLVP